MAFFGLTQLGYQDTIREHVKDPMLTPQHIYRSGLSRQEPKIILPPIDPNTLPQAPIVPINQVSGYGPGPLGSYGEFTRHRTKHIRNAKGTVIIRFAYFHYFSRIPFSCSLVKPICFITEPVEIYRRAVTTSGLIGDWRRREPIREKEPWTFVPRACLVNSEMTRFAILTQLSLLLAK